MAIKLPTIAPKVNLPAAPKSSMTAFGTYPMIGQLKPMPAAVANNISLGWDYAKGQVIQPLTPAQKAQVYIPPFSPNIKTPTQPVIPPGGPAINTIKPGQPALPQQQFNWSVQTPVKIGGAVAPQQNLLINQFLPKPAAQAPVRPVAPKTAVAMGRS